MAEGQRSIENGFLRDIWRSNSVNSSDEDETNILWEDYKPFTDEHALDLSFLALDSATLLHNFGAYNNKAESSHVKYLYLHHNRLEIFPENISRFYNLVRLDVSHNQLTEIGDAITLLQNLVMFNARNNFLGEYSLPKKMSMLKSLKELNLSGNRFKTISQEIIDLQNLRSLYFGGNEIEEVPRDIWKLEKLEILYLGGNSLKDIPAEMGRLHCLKSLVLCENQLQSLPSTISCLRSLRSLLLHKNQLTTLPPEIVTLRGLVELSLRDNPLVVRFVQEMIYEPPTLRELAARCIKIFRVPFSEREMPRNLLYYLQTACRCVNPKCKGVYFDTRVEHIKFVDFCGKYRIPLLQYLCSPRCSVQPAFHNSDSNSSDDENDVPRSRLNRVLLG